VPIGLVCVLIVPVNGLIDNVAGVALNVPPVVPEKDTGSKPEPIHTGEL
jgi:hypothetical protein